MAAFDRRDANLKKLKEADQIQDKTKDAITRIQRQTAEAEELGAQTLDELRRQGQQMVITLLLQLLISTRANFETVYCRTISTLSSSL